MRTVFLVLVAVGWMRKFGPSHTVDVECVSAFCSHFILDTSISNGAMLMSALVSMFWASAPGCANVWT